MTYAVGDKKVTLRLTTEVCIAMNTYGGWFVTNDTIRDTAYFWDNDGKSISLNSQYDFIKEPVLIPDVVPWLDISTKFIACATDANETSWLFVAKPQRMDRCWYSNEIFIDARYFTNFRPGTVDWKDSEQTRPGVV